MLHFISLGALLILWGSVAGHASVANAGIGLVAMLLTIGKLVREERLLRSTLPGYVQYASSTKAVIPFVL